jgi:hypothetical protein
VWKNLCGRRKSCVNPEKAVWTWKNLCESEKSYAERNFFISGGKSGLRVEKFVRARENLRKSIFW